MPPNFCPSLGPYIFVKCRPIFKTFLLAYCVKNCLTASLRQDHGELLTRYSYAAGLYNASMARLSVNASVLG